MWVHMGLGEGTACCPVAFGFFELCTPESCPWVHLLVQQTFPEHFCGGRCQAHCCGFGADLYTASMPKRGSQPGGDAGSVPMLLEQMTIDGGGEGWDRGWWQFCSQEHLAVSREHFGCHN